VECALAVPYHNTVTHAYNATYHIPHTPTKYINPWKQRIYVARRERTLIERNSIISILIHQTLPRAQSILNIYQSWVLHFHVFSNAWYVLTFLSQHRCAADSSGGCCVCVLCQNDVKRPRKSYYGVYVLFEERRIVLPRLMSPPVCMILRLLIPF
jgi:hypothetical protein